MHATCCDSATAPAAPDMQQPSLAEACRSLHFPTCTMVVLRALPAPFQVLALVSSPWQDDSRLSPRQCLGKRSSTLVFQAAVLSLGDGNSAGSCLKLCKDQQPHQAPWALYWQASMSSEVGRTQATG